MTDEYPPKRARTLEEWAAYWDRQPWRRRARRQLRMYAAPWKRRVRPFLPRTAWRAYRTLVLRAQRGWAPRDCWNLDDYLCRVAGEAVEHLRLSTHGYFHLQDDCALDGNCSCAEEYPKLLERISAPLLAYRTHWDAWELDGLDRKARYAEENRIISEAQDAFRLLADNLTRLWD